MSEEAPDSTLSTFTACDGGNLAVQDWALPEGVPSRGMVLIVHGLGEHAGRYDHVAKRLNAWGFTVRSYDQYGHGDSDGLRGGLPQSMRLLDDLYDMVESCRRRLPDNRPLILLGHSMGGLVAASFVARQLLPVDALVLSSPAFATRLGRFQKTLMAVVPRMAPNLTVGNGLDPHYLSHDPRVVAAYRADPRVHDRISGRLASFIAEEGPEVLARARNWRVPTLLLYAGDDRLVDPAGSRAFAAAAPPPLVTERCFSDFFHEIFNEVEAYDVFASLRQWLDARF
ncbi:MAG TPA: lysophospholipase [Ramlibacter sp.]|nr:lysophospholipase [Ramlibacter sp.]